MAQTFGLALKHAMLDAGMTQARLAQEVGLSKTTVNLHATGKQQPTLPQLEAYSRVLGVRFVVAPAVGLEPTTYRSPHTGDAA